MPHLSPADAAWLHMEQPNNLMMITGLLFLREAPERDWMEAFLEHRLCQFERFRMKIVEPALGVGLPRWQKTEKLDVKRHLVYEHLEDPSESGLLQRAGQLMSQRLDREHPLWEFRVFPGIQGGAAMIVRLHHAIGDGIALMRVLLSLCDTSPDAPRPRSDQESCHLEKQEGAFQKAKRLTSHLIHEGHDLIFHPSHAAEIARAGMGASKALSRLLSLPADSENAFRGPLQPKKLAALSNPFPLSAIKSVGKRLGCTINDVLMAVLAGSLGRSLRRFQDLDPSYEIRVIVPVDLRGGDVSQLGNQFGIIFLTLPVGETDPRARLATVHDIMGQLKQSAEAVVAFELLSVVGGLPTSLETPIIQWFGNKATAVVTNLPGPKKKLYLAGAEIESMMYWVPQSGRLGLGVSLMSYAGQIRVGVATDAALIPDPQQLVDDFMTTLDETLSLEAL